VFLVSGGEKGRWDDDGGGAEGCAGGGKRWQGRHRRAEQLISTSGDGRRQGSSYGLMFRGLGSSTAA
jgi:hypothetical protein